MKRANNFSVCLVLIFLGAACSGCEREEPGVEIPLNKIWGHAIPGTQDMHLLEPEHFGPVVRQLPGQEQHDLFESSLWYQIHMAIDPPSGEQQIGPGFAVAGTGHESLAAVKKILQQEQKPSQAFPAGAKVSLFFFTRDSYWPVHIKSVAKSENAITIRYYFVPHRSTGLVAGSSCRYFALIPLGKLPVGNYAVDVIQTLERKYQGRGYQVLGKEVGEKYVCKSFAFTVVHDEKEDKLQRIETTPNLKGRNDEKKN